MKRFKHKLLCEALEDRFNPSGAILDYDQVSGMLLDLQEGRISDALSIDAEGRVNCRVTTNDVATLLPALERLGFELTVAHPESYYATGWLPITSIAAAEALGDAGVLNGVVPAIRGWGDVGVTTSQGADVLGSTFVNSKAGTGFDGTGIKVGVISDSFNKNSKASTNYAQDIASKDLPASLFYNNDAASGTDEGRGMMQIVYDVAPGAALGFATYGTDFDTMALAINNLVAAGANVIVDDLTYMDEPIYQDSASGKAYTAAASAKVVGISNSGNYIRAYEQVGFATTSDALIGGATFLDYSGTGDARNSFTIPANRTYNFNLQWDDPFYSPGNVKSNLDLYIVANGGNTILNKGILNNLITDEPSEYIAVSNPTGSPMVVDVLVRSTAGPLPGRVHVKTRAFAGGTWEYGGGNAVIGSNGATDVISVAAAPFYDQRVPESFTSVGTSISVFTPAGVRRPSPIDLVKPDVTGPDDANTSFFGSTGVPDGDAFPNFSGTSAAAPHIAGVAALMLQQTPTLLPAQIESQMIATARDIFTPGWDTSTGAGMVDAFHAVYGAQTSATIGVGDPFINDFEVGLGQSWKIYGDVNGRVRIVDNTVVEPFAGSKSLVLDSFHGSAVKSTTYAEFQFNGLVPELQFTFAAKNLGDESDDIDGVYLTNDNGVSFVQLLDLNTVPNTWTAYSYDLHAAASKAGQALNANSRIRFYQWDDSRVENLSDPDGFAFDQISIITTASPVTRNWLGGAPTNNWNEATNWFPSGQPNASDVLFIPAGAFVNINSGANAKRIYSYGTLNLAAGGTISVSERMDTYGTVQWFGGTVNNNGTWYTHNSVTWNDGLWDNGDADTGKLVIGAGKNFTMTGNVDRFIYAGNIENYGNALWYDGSVYSAYGGVWKNMPGSTFTASANDDHWAQRPGYPGPATGFTVGVDSTFIKDSNTNDIRFDGALNLQGIVNVTTGRISGNGGGDFRHTNITGTVELDGGTFTSTVNDQFVFGTGKVIVNGGLLSMPVGKTLSFTNLDLAAGGISDLGTVAVYTSFNWTGGFFESAGTTRFEPLCTTTITGPADRIIHARLFENYGPATWSDGTIYAAYGGNWVNKLGSSFTITAGNNDNWLQRPGYPGPATAFTVDSGANLIKDGGAADVNFDGPLNVQGNFSINGGPVSGRGGGSVGHATNSAIASGRIELEGGTFNAVNGGKFTSTGGFRVNGGTLTNAAGERTTFGTLDLAPNGTIAGTGTLAVTLYSNWTGGIYDTAGAGVTEFGPIATVTIDGAADRIIHARTFHNFGEAYWDDGTVYGAYTGNWINKGGSKFVIRHTNDNWLQRPGYPGPCTAMTVEHGATLIKGGTGGIQNDVVFNGALNIAGNFEVLLGAVSGTGGGSIGHSTVAATGTGGRIELEGGTFNAVNGGVFTGNGRFALTGGILNIAKDTSLTLSGFDLDSGYTDGPGTLTVTGNTAWTKGGLFATGATNFTSTANIQINGVDDHYIRYGTVNNFGTATWNDGTMRGGYGGNFINKSGSNFTILNDNDSWLQQSGIPSPCTAFSVESGATFVKEGFANDVIFNGALNIGGAFAISKGAVSGTGGGSIGSAGPEQTGNAGRIELEGGTFNAVHGGVYNGAGRFALTGGILNIADGKNLTLSGFDLDAGYTEGPGTLTVTGNTAWTGGGLFATGLTVFTSTANIQLNGTGDHYIRYGIVHNFGTATWNNGTMRGGYGGNFINKNGSTFTIKNDDDHWHGQSGIPGPVTAFSTERGAMLVKDTNPNDVVFQGGLNIGGNFNMVSGAISGTGGGSVGSPDGPSVGTGGRIELEGGTFNAIHSAVYTGTGRFAMTGGILNLATGVALTLSGFDLDAGYTDGPGTLTVTGNTAWTSGGLFASGVTNFTSTANIQLNGTGDHYIRYGTVNNFGQATWNNGTMRGGYGGNFINKNGSTFTIKNDDDNWHGQSGVPGPVTAFSTERGATLVKDTNANDVQFHGGLNIGGDFNMVSGTISGFSGGSVGSADGPSIGHAGRIELEGGTFTAVHGGVYTGAGRIATTGGFAGGGGLLDIPAGKTLTLSGLDLDGGGVSGLGTLTVTAGGTWTGGGLFNAGKTIFTSTATMTANTAKDHYIHNRFVENSGQLNWENGHFRTAYGGEWKNLSGSKVTITTDDDVWTGQSGYPGPITSFTSTVGSTLTRNGNATAVEFYGPFNAAGDVTVSKGTVSLLGGGSLGTLTVTDGAFRFSGGTFNVTGNATVGGAGGLTVDGGIINILNGSSLNATNLFQSNGQIAGEGNFFGTNATWTGGWHVGPGTSTFSGGVAISGPGDKLIYGRPMINNGNVAWTAGNILSGLGSNITWTNGANSTFDIQGDFIWGGISGYPGPVMTMTNAANGLLKKSAGAGIARFDNLVSNAGTVQVLVGTLQSAGDFVQSGGRTIVSGVLDPTGANTTLNGGTLEGTGTILSNVNNAAGNVKPGSSPGTLSVVGNYTQAGAYDVELHGTAVGAFDKLEVIGGVSLGGALNVSVNYAAQIGQSFIVLDNDGTDAITGTFTDLPAGKVFTASGYSMQISYTGGTGNDVAVTVIAAPIPNATGYVVNDGDPQRSSITKITIQFDNPVQVSDFSAFGAIKLKRTAVSSIPTGAVNDLVQTGPAALNHITLTQGTASSLVLTFDNNGAFNSISNGVENGSLSDGYWQLIVGNFTSMLNDLNLRRLFGDNTNDANGGIDGSDLTVFGNVFNTANVAFDFTNDGVVDGSDLTVFGNRFGNVL